MATTTSSCLLFNLFEELGNLDGISLRLSGYYPCTWCRGETALVSRQDTVGNSRGCAMLTRVVLGQFLGFLNGLAGIR